MNKWNTDRIVSVSAILISLATLFLIFYQTNLIRKEQKASVMPSLTIGYSVDGKNGKIMESVWITNQGLGPAFIDHVQILEGESVYDTDPYGYLSKMNAKNEISFINRIVPGRIIPVNTRVTALEKKTDSASAIILSNLFEYSYDIPQMPTDQMQKAVIEIQYRNVYGDRWSIRSDQTSPVALN